MWFTTASSRIGETSTTGVITDFSNPAIIGPQSITEGPDGDLWFTDQYLANGDTGAVGQMTSKGAVTVYTDPSFDHLGGITAGPDGALWFTISGGNSIGRMSSSGELFEYTDPSIDDPTSIATGPDGHCGSRTTGQLDRQYHHGRHRSPTTPIDAPTIDCSR